MSVQQKKNQGKHVFIIVIYNFIIYLGKSEQKCFIKVKTKKCKSICLNEIQGQPLTCPLPCLLLLP